MCLSFNVLQVSWVYERAVRATYHSVSLFQILFVEDIFPGVSPWRPLPAGFGSGNLFLGQHLPELGGSIDRHAFAQWI